MGLVYDLFNSIEVSICLLSQVAWIIWFDIIPHIGTILFCPIIRLPLGWVFKFLWQLKLALLDMFGGIFGNLKSNWRNIFFSIICMTYYAKYSLCTLEQEVFSHILLRCTCVKLGLVLYLLLKFLISLQILYF